MNFRYRGLPSEPFAGLFDLTDPECAARGMRRVVADEKPGFPCRVTLEDAEPGEALLLLPFEHQPAHSPYRAAGPIFIRAGQHATYDATQSPPVLLGRLLSVRAYDDDGMMIEADVAEGCAIEPLLERLFAHADTSYVHLHYARRGCFACRVERA
ncbi:MAG TPA: DUF1203 domain-containing protein [Rhizomicrobium sp.]|jgi:hypothetical protein